MAWKTSDFDGPALQCFLKKFLFASVRVMAGHFSVDYPTIKSILDRELGLRKFPRRWVPHIPSAEQELRRVTGSESLLTIRANIAEKCFQGTIAGDEPSISSLDFRYCHHIHVAGVKRMGK
jgi:hypothetical protein